MKIVIVGAGKTGAFLGAKLTEENDVTLIEVRPSRAERVRQMLSSARVIEGDACEPSILEKAGIGGADLLVATTGDDEDNLVVAMLAHEYDVARVVGRVNHPANEWLFDKEWGVDQALSGPGALWHLVEGQCDAAAVQTDSTD
ncbi:MAG: potassium channel family protein [Coriobacteriia bacterium]